MAGWSGLLWCDQSCLIGEDHRLDPVADPELAQQAGDVAFHCCLADEQAFGQLGVGEPAGLQREYLGLSLG
jgi:hypothetical protein